MGENQDPLYVAQVESVMKQLLHNETEMRRIIDYVKNPESSNIASMSADIWLMDVIVLCAVLAVIAALVCYFRAPFEREAGQKPKRSEKRADEGASGNLESGDPGHDVVAPLERNVSDMDAPSCFWKTNSSKL